jgi:hypothetical protein
MSDSILVIRGNDVVRRAYDRMKQAAVQKATASLQKAADEHRGEMAEIMRSIDRECRTDPLKARIRKYGEPAYVARGFPVYKR